MPGRNAHSLIATAITQSEPSLTMGASVAARLRDLILRGELPGGTPLVLAPLAEHLQVSVMPVREALRLLEAEGLVVVRPRRGAVVSEPSIGEAEEIYTVRIALESLCARHATERLTAADVADLRDCFQAMTTVAASEDLRAFVIRDHEFHLRLYRTSGRESLVKSIEDLTSRSLRYIPYLYRSHEVEEDPLYSHSPLLSAIELRDPLLVESLTRIHMERSRTRLLSAIRHSMEEHASHGTHPHRLGSDNGPPSGSVTTSHIEGSGQQAQVASAGGDNRRQTPLRAR